MVRGSAIGSVRSRRSLYRRDGPTFFAVFFQSQPFALMWASFFFLLLKLPQFCALFWYTSNQGAIVTAFFAFGAVLGAHSFSFLIIAFMDKYRIIQIILLILFTLGLFVCLSIILG